MPIAVKANIARKFSLAASSYDAEALVQQQVADSLLKRILEETSQPEENLSSSILELGCGTGYLSHLLVSRFSPASFRGIDLSTSMLEVANKKLAPYAAKTNISLDVLDISNLETSRKYNLIVSSSTLHWLSDLESLFVKIRKSLLESGKFTFSLMLDGTLEELKQAREQVVRSENVSAIEFPKYEKVLDCLKKSGFDLEYSQHQLYQETFDNPSQFLKSLKKRGVQGKVNSVKPFSFSNSSKVLKILDLGPNQKMKASYVVGTFLAKVD